MQIPVGNTNCYIVSETWDGRVYMACFECKNNINIIECKWTILFLWFFGSDWKPVDFIFQWALGIIMQLRNGMEWKHTVIPHIRSLIKGHPYNHVAISLWQMDNLIVSGPCGIINEACTGWQQSTLRISQLLMGDACTAELVGCVLEAYKSFHFQHCKITHNKSFPFSLLCHPYTAIPFHILKLPCTFLHLPITFLIFLHFLAAQQFQNRKDLLSNIEVNKEDDVFFP